MRVRFLQRFDYRVNGQVVLAFKAGEERTVTRHCGSQAVAAGSAVEIDPPPRPS